MEQDCKLIGAPCAVRGPYTFYKAFKYTKNGVTDILTINEFFFVKLWNDSDLISIGELRLLWEDQNCDKALASLRLYILPENTPDGRVGDIHGEDEVLAITEKVIIKLEDLLTWITEASDWNWGLSSIWTKEHDVKSEPDFVPVEPKLNGSVVNADGENKENNNAPQNRRTNTLEDFSVIDYSDVSKEKALLDLKNWENRTGVVVLSYSRYCRYRALLRRLEGVHNDWLRDDLITALGGFATTYRTTKILFCRDTFDYPELEGHELLCNHLAPKLRSRIPKKKKALYPSPDISETDGSSEYGTEDEDRSSSASSSSSTNSNHSVAARCSSTVETGIKKNEVKNPSSTFVSAAQQAFVQNLYAFMKARLTPIGRLPLIGNKEINLYEFYNKVKLLGNYASVTNNKLWKYVFEELGGDRSDPSMAALMRKYYEKFLLPYEQHMLQQLKHSPAHQSTSGVIKSQYIPTTMNSECSRYQADRRKGTTIRPVPPGLRLIESKTAINVFSSNKPVPGDKENIPLSDKRKLSTTSRPAEVIDLCVEEEGTSRSASQKPSANAPEVIDLCEESPIKRSVPSIAATLLPKKRKLDILREGGLEVTPVSSIEGSSSDDFVTIMRTPSSSTATKAHIGDREEISLEILDTKRYSSSGHPKAKLTKMASQILDLRTIKNCDKQDLVKKFSPSLGPNIEISLVANDSPPPRREEKKRKPIPLPIPALRKISTGELSVKNLTVKVNAADDVYKPKTSSNAKKISDVTLTKTSATKPLVSISSSVTATPIMHHQNSSSREKIPTSQAFVPNVNPSFYLAALYNSIFPTSGSPAFVGDAANVNPYQLQLTQQQINYVKGAFMHHPEQEWDVSQFANMLKNGTVSIVDNYEKILPD